MRTELRTEEMNMVNGGLVKISTNGDAFWLDVYQDESPNRMLAGFSTKVSGTYADWDKVIKQVKEYAVDNGVSTDAHCCDWDCELIYHRYNGDMPTLRMA